MEYFNKLTPGQLERLALLSEELGEAQQAVGKILRHGYEECSPEANPCLASNRTDLQKELGDVRLAIALLAEASDVSGLHIERREIYKREAIKQYLHHQ